MAQPAGRTDSARSRTQLRAFAAELRRWQLEHGAPSIRALAYLMKDAGKPFPRSTISDKLAAVSPPSWDFVATFLDACARFQPSRSRALDIDAWRTRYDLMIGEVNAERSVHRVPAAAWARSGPSTSARPVPREIPAAPSRFTGRADQLGRLDAIRTHAGRGTVPIALVTGTAGIGKSALAISWAHQISDAYPDGQIFLNLRGYDPANRLSVSESLAAVLRSFGVPDSEMPDDPEERAGLLRTVLADRRALLLLDNAASLNQIRHLLPAQPGCIVIITSRDTLPGLVALYGAEHIRLRPLPVHHAVSLLASMLGAEATEAQHPLTDLAARCAGVPLALRIVGEIALGSPAVPLETLSRRLADPDQLLDGLAADDDTQVNIRAAFAWSYRQLPPSTAGLFRLMGSHPGAGYDAYDAAALADIHPTDAARLLNELHRAHLVEDTGIDRFGMHDLLRAYAVELGRLTPTDETDAAVGRLYTYYLATAARAVDLTFPGDRDRRPAVLAGDRTPFELVDRTGARGWLDRQLPTLMALSHGTGPLAEAYVATLSTIIWRHMDSAACHLDAIDLQERALANARAGADRAGEARALARLGRVRIRLGQCPAAIEILEQALRIAADVADPRIEGDIRNTIGLAQEQLGNWVTAGEYLRSAVTLARENHDRSAEAGALTNLSRVLRHVGELDDAEACLIEAVRLSNACDDLVGEGRATAHLGFLHYLRGAYDEANRYEQAALRIFDVVSDPLGQAWALGDLGRVLTAQNDLGTALEHHHRALDLFTVIGDTIGQAFTQDDIGAIHHRRGEPDLAERHWRTALDLARVTGHRVLEATVLDELSG